MLAPAGKQYDVCLFPERAEEQSPHVPRKTGNVLTAAWPIAINAVCDAKGRPLILLLTPGNVHDCKAAQRCIEAMPPAAELVADKGYDSKALRDWLAERGTTAVIPPRKNRKVQYHYDKTVYRQRNIIERMFCRLKDWRRIATRFDRNITNFIAAIALAAAVIWWL